MGGFLMNYQINGEGIVEVFLKGKIVKISEIDLWIIDVFPNWQIIKGYVSCTRWIETDYGSVEQRVYLHRLVVGTKNKTWQVDHANRDKLDNTRNNLRFATASQNASNTVKKRKPKSGFRGVCKDKRPLKKQFISYINTGKGKRKNLGRFETAEEAAKIYDIEAKKRYGEFAILNFP